ncbi:MAG: Hpt domain-containing protein [Lentisphaeria bacterium]|nr:Hpt domain-containing protein [Lentisphaeria bacterium]
MNLSCIDLSHINQIVEIGGEELLSELITMFKEVTDERLLTAQHQLDEKEYLELGKTIHALKSGVGNLGAFEMVQAANQLELTCKGDSPDKAKEEFDVLKGHYSKALNALTYIKNNKQSQSS